MFDCNNCEGNSCRGSQSLWRQFRAGCRFVTVSCHGSWLLEDPHCCATGSRHGFQTRHWWQDESRKGRRRLVLPPFSWALMTATSSKYVHTFSQFAYVRHAIQRCQTGCSTTFWSIHKLNTNHMHEGTRPQSGWMSYSLPRHTLIYKNAARKSQISINRNEDWTYTWITQDKYKMIMTPCRTEKVVFSQTKRQQQYNQTIVANHNQQTNNSTRRITRKKTQKSTSIFLFFVFWFVFCCSCFFCFCKALWARNNVNNCGHDRNNEK